MAVLGRELVVPPPGRGRDIAPGLVVCQNGLALCTIHHAAFDTHVTRLRPNPDYLAERFERFRAA